MKRFTRCIVYPRVSSFCCMLEEQQEKFHQASFYENVCPLRGVSAIARYAVWKTNISKGSLKYHFMNTSAAA